MPFLVGPTTITGAVFTVEPPAAAGISVRDFDRVVLSNASPYLLQLANSGNRGWLQPFTANVYPYDPDTPQITVTPSLQGVVIVGNPTQLTAEFFRTGEPLDNRTYPAPVQLFSTINQFASTQLASGVAASTSGVSQVFDVSQFASYQLRWNWVGGAADQLASVLIEWLDTIGNVIFVEAVSFISDGSRTLAVTGSAFKRPESLITDGCHGDRMQVTPTFASGTLHMTINATSRTVDKFRVTQPIHEAQNRLLASDTSFSLAAGAVSSIFWGGPQPGPAHLRVVPGVAKYGVRLYLGSLTAQQIAFQLPNSVEYIADLILPRAPVGVQIENDSTVTGSFNVELVSTND
jgi:hypothetical protein